MYIHITMVSQMLFLPIHIGAERKRGTDVGEWTRGSASNVLKSRETLHSERKTNLLN